MEKLSQRIEQHIKSQGRGWAFTRKDFQEIAPTGPVGVILSRLVEGGVIRRLGRGLFDFPRNNPSLGGQLSPDMDQVAQALSRHGLFNLIRVLLNRELPPGAPEVLTMTLQLLKNTFPQQELTNNEHRVTARRGRILHCIVFFDFMSCLILK